MSDYTPETLRALAADIEKATGDNMPWLEGHLRALADAWEAQLAAAIAENEDAAGLINWPGTLAQKVERILRDLVAEQSAHAETKRRLEALEMWRNLAMSMHPNLDLDIDWYRKNDPHMAALADRTPSPNEPLAAKSSYKPPAGPWSGPTTHWEGCWEQDKHGACARRRVRELEQDLASEHEQAHLAELARALSANGTFWAG